MSTSHLFFIPATILVGAIFGWMMGRKMLLAEQAERRKAEERKAARRAARDNA